MRRIDRKTYLCPGCGNSFERIPCHRKGKTAACSKKCADEIRAIDPKSRFWTKVDKTGSCWNWIGAKGRDGYGMFWLNRKNIPAHKFSLIQSVGESDLLALHRCDNKSCVNPQHLYWGDTKQNSKDARERGQLAIGERAGGAKLTAQDVLAIRRMHEPNKPGGWSLRKLAEKYGVNYAHVSGIILRKSWRHLPHE